ncbi:DUF1836 domain-containing protein [Paenibacillus thermoaerophilus]|uniref:DUF1836 domain-containing protein n=1 Tax=Paenibacillus thermoaerophilus TaxID=1215385 RepID=A0ABW2V0V1_9BACL|nr:DUF1836 domain-containing protein [Paenibacillus thermoaerophilus]TMV17295.1 DUF1836 domain-containing protein [Paenibacillus thermoaerophilus]
METLTFTRREMALLLRSLQNGCEPSPLSVLRRIWNQRHSAEVEQGASFGAFMETALPPIWEKWLKSATVQGLSLQEIVSLGNQIEYTNLSVTSAQNWVKRDFCEYLGKPAAGKKYSFQQAALIYIIEDLKHDLDFESIRKLLRIVLREPERDEDDLITPIDLYAAYSGLFEELDANNDQLLDVTGHVPTLVGKRNQDVLMEQLIQRKADQFVNGLALQGKQKEAVRNVLMIAMIAVQTAYFHALARRFFNATLFLYNSD